MSEAPDIQVVRDYFSELQRSICARLEELDGAQRFRGDESASPGGGVARPRVIEGGTHLEKAAVQFTHSVGASLPPAATERNPHLVGHGFQAVAISLIVHPRNPHAPTTHMNLRFFLVETQEPVWYFGGGFDLTPYYGYEDDCVHWHQQALNACARTRSNGTRTSGPQAMAAPAMISSSRRKRVSVSVARRGGGRRRRP